MASREILEDAIERLTVQLKLTKAALKSTSEEFQQTQKTLETLEKEHKRVIHEIGELQKREPELIEERDEAKESARKALESLSEFVQACVDHFTDAIGATLAKDVIRSKPSTLDKALSEALELEALEIRAVRMRESVVSEVSTHEKEAC